MSEVKPSVNRVLKTLERGRLVTVRWLDASESRGVVLKQGKLPNRVVETRKTTSGYFWGVQKGEHWKKLHIVLGTERTDESWVVTVIPLSIVMQVEPSGVKEPLKLVRAVASPLGKTRGAGRWFKVRR